jgi:Xaa-Pro aminopeptidase
MGYAEAARLSERQAKLRRSMTDLDLDAAIVTRACNVRYLTNHIGSAGIVVLTQTAVHLLVDSRYAEAVRRLQASPSACPLLELHVVPGGSGGYDEGVARCLARLDPSSVGFEATHVTVSGHASWQRALERHEVRVSLTATQGLLERQRVVKDVDEVGILREAAQRLSPVAEAAFQVASAGVSERTVAAVIDTALGAAGFERPAFDTIVASGPHSALPHHNPGDRSLTEGDLVLLDFGGVLDGYCSDISRTVAIGRLTPERVRLHKAVREAHAAALAVVRPGTRASDVDAAARNVLIDYGLGDAFGHATGHGLGLEVHEDPRIGQPHADGRSVELEPGMVFTVEPGAYLPDTGGVRIEDDVLVTETGYEVLTTVPRELLTLR